MPVDFKINPKQNALVSKGRVEKTEANMILAKHNAIAD